MKHHATSLFLLILSLLTYLKDSSASNRGLNDELRFIHQEIGQLRDENHNQNKEIATLKEIIGLQNNQTTLDQLTELLLGHQKTKKLLVIGDIQHPSERARRRSKRPARLLPLQLLYNRSNQTDNSTDQRIRRFYGPPTNCLELSQLGYTLNGFYLVKSTAHNINNINKDGNTKLEAISCSFRHPQGAALKPPNNIIEKRVGTLKLSGSKSLNDATSGGVYFRARTESDIKSIHKLSAPFGKVLLNMGGGYYENTGVFTVPKTGIYQLIFQGFLWSDSGSKKYAIDIQFQRNENISPDFTRIEDSHRLNRVLHETAQLNRGDNISVIINPLNSVQKFELLAYATFSCSLLEDFE